MGSKKLKLKLLVDGEKKKVIFAEADKDFVDFLFSFLTMPLGSVIHLLNKQSSVGCIDKLYESIANLDDWCFSTEACKQMLLRPNNASGRLCEDLILRIDEYSNPRIFHTCQKKECAGNSTCSFSMVPKARCVCGDVMNFNWYRPKKEHRGPNGDGVFVKGIVNFIICDDLVVMPATTANMRSVINKHGIKDLDNIEETSIDMGAIMLDDLLRRCLTSKFPLSGMYFKKTDCIENPDFFLKAPKSEDRLADKEPKKEKVKISLCKSSNKVLYAEAEGGFVNLLFSILTLPLGTIVELLDKFSSVGCLDNLYKSVENMSCECKYFKPDVSNLLLHPDLAAHFGHSDSLFSVNEMAVNTEELPGCHSCFINRSFHVGSTCKHGVKNVNVTERNPKLLSGDAVGGSYAKMDVRFIITDDLEMKPFSSVCSFRTIKKCNASLAALEETEIYIDELEALNLLKACLTSQSPLTNVFSTPAKEAKNKVTI